MVGLGRIGQLGIADECLPSGAGLRAKLVEEGLPGYFLQEQRIQRGIRRHRAQAAIEGLEPGQGVARLVALCSGQGINGLLERLGHAWSVEHLLEFVRQQGDLVVLQRHQATAVVTAVTCQLRQALGALRVVPGVGQLHAVALGRLRWLAWPIQPAGGS